MKRIAIGLLFLFLIYAAYLFYQKQKSLRPLTNEEKAKLLIQKSNECQSQKPKPTGNVKTVNGIKIFECNPYVYVGGNPIYGTRPNYYGVWEKYITGYEPAYCSVDTKQTTWVNDKGQYVDPLTGKPIVAGYGKG